MSAHEPASAPATDTTSRITELLVEILGCPWDSVEREAFLADDLGADSLDAIEVIMEVEDRFGIDISDEEAKRVLTVGNLVDLVVRVTGSDA